MKKRKLVLSSLLALALMVPVSAKEVDTSVAVGTQKIIITGEAWGPGVTKTIVTLDKEVDADSLDVEDFIVTQMKEGMDYSTGEKVPQTTEREVTAVYLADEKGNKVEAKSGKTIAMDLYISPSIGNPFIYDIGVGLNVWPSYYNLTVELAENATVTSNDSAISAISVEEAIDLHDRTQTLIPQTDNVENLTFTGKDGITLSYGSYEPAKDSEKHPLVIWLHGSGEGGTDPYIPMLGNEVTALFSDEFQSTMGGAYVLVPQSPTKWSDSGELDEDGKPIIYCTGHQQCVHEQETDSMYVDTLTELIKSYVETHPDVDPNRIIIGGCSNGGYMTTRMLIANPGYFAGAYLNAESFADAHLSDEFIQSLIDDEIGLWYVYCNKDNVQASSVPTTKRLAAKENFHVSEYDEVIDTSGRYFDAEGNPHEYSAHWAWTYFFDNQVKDGNLSEWEWMASLSRTPAEAPVTPSVPTVGINTNPIYLAIATIALAGAGYVVYKKKQD